MHKISNKKLFALLSSRQGDSFQLGKEFFSFLSPEEKEEMKRLLNETSMDHFYLIREGSIERTATTGIVTLNN